MGGTPHKGSAAVAVASRFVVAFTHLVFALVFVLVFVLV